MGKFSGVLLASDYDNTLLNTETPFLRGGALPDIPARNREALAYFMDNGGTFTIATGRGVPSIMRYAADVPSNAPFVVCNGAAVYDFRRRVYLDRFSLPDAVPGYCQDVLERFPTAAAEVYPLSDEVHVVRPNAITRNHERVTGVRTIENAVLSDVPLPLVKLMFEDTHEQLLLIQSYLAQQPWTALCEIFFTAKTLLEVTARGATKGAMVLRLAERLHIDRKNLYCAGDEANDITMLEIAAEGFAPSNCVPAVRESGATIVCDCDSGAIAEIVERLDRRYYFNPHND